MYLYVILLIEFLLNFEGDLKCHFKQFKVILNGFTNTIAYLMD